MLVFTRYPELEFTWFVLNSDTPIDEWLATMEEYANQGLTKYELYDLRKARIDVEQFTSLISTLLLMQLVLVLICDLPKARPPSWSMKRWYSV